jgi:hypothetical protein
MDIEQIKELKTKGETLSIFVFNLLNHNKNNPMHELFKEEEPRSIVELCDALRDYTLSLTFNYPNLPKLPSEQDAIIAEAIQQLDTVVGSFHDKYYKGERTAAVQEDLRTLATFFATKHVVIESYLNYLLHKSEEPSPESSKAKL